MKIRLLLSLLVVCGCVLFFRSFGAEAPPTVYAQAAPGGPLIRTAADLYTVLDTLRDPYPLPVLVGTTAGKGVDQANSAPRSTAPSGGNSTGNFHANARFTPADYIDCGNGTTCHDPVPVCFTCRDGFEGCASASPCWCTFCPDGREVCPRTVSAPRIVEPMMLE